MLIGESLLNGVFDVRLLTFGDAVFCSRTAGAGHLAIGGRDVGADSDSDNNINPIYLMEADSMSCQLQYLLLR